MFWKQKSSEYDGKLLDIIKENSVEVVKLRAEVDKVTQDMKTLRGLVNRKLKLEPEEEIETSIKNDGFDEFRGLRKEML